MDLVQGDDFDVDGKNVTGIVKVERVNGRSVATRVFSRYPLKFLIPTKMMASEVDAVWMYAITYGGGLVSGDAIHVQLDVAESATAVLTTQSSTKVFKSLKGMLAEQWLKASVGNGALLAVLPDPVTCFAAAKFSQVWIFDSYKSRNHIYVGESRVLLLDNVCLEQGVALSVAKRMQGFHVIAMLTVYGSRVATFRQQLQDKVQMLAKKNFGSSPRMSQSSTSQCDETMLISACSVGDKDEGLVIRITAKTTEMVYDFLRAEFETIVALVGALPFAGR